MTVLMLSLRLGIVLAFVLNVIASGMISDVVEQVILCCEANFTDTSTICGSPGATTSIFNMDDLNSLNNCTEIQGNLYVQAPGKIPTLMLPPSLVTITGGLVCNGTASKYTTIQAPSLTTINSAKNNTSNNTNSGLVITNYPSLTNLSFPTLTSIGSQFVLGDNDLLLEISGFDLLAQVGGNLEITGNFYSLNLPSLVSVGGDVDIETSANNFTCPIPQLQSSVSAAGGSFVCSGNIKQANVTQPASSTNSVASSSSSPTSSSSSSSAKSEARFLEPSKSICKAAS